MKCKGDLIATLDLFCRAMPLKRGRRTVKSITQPLDNQTSMIEQLIPHANLMIDIPIIIEVACGYMKFKRKGKMIVTYDVDNILKGILDNLQRMGVIANDKDVIGASILKHEAVEDCIHIEIYEARNY